jgi:hypothetical protein
MNIMRKIIIVISAVMLAGSGVYSQNKRADKVSRYETVIYTSDKIDVLIQKEYSKQSGLNQEARRGYLTDLGEAFLSAGKGIAGGYVTSVIDIGVGAVAALITRNANEKVKWEEVVKAENLYQETLTTVDAINNFYSVPSFNSPMDPSGINFDGIGCVRTIEGDTVFCVSCHIDPSKISRIINHSKFELSLDTLIIDPYHCNLPNSNFDTRFSFDRRENLQITIEIRLISSWINYAAQIQKNQELGSFVINVPVSKSDLDDSGKLRYVRTGDSPAKYKVVGESFIVPRSFMGYLDSRDSTYHDSWGTGDYKIELSLKESCNITDTYRKGWKRDWKQRQDAENDENFVQRSWKMISSQRWDDITKQWVVTTLKAPADMITGDLLEKLNLPAPETGNGAAKQSGGTPPAGTAPTGGKQQGEGGKK